jgi:hypothetical protein
MLEVAVAVNVGDGVKVSVMAGVAVGAGVSVIVDVTLGVNVGVRDGASVSVGGEVGVKVGGSVGRDVLVAGRGVIEGNSASVGKAAASGAVSLLPVSNRYSPPARTTTISTMMIPVSMFVMRPIAAYTPTCRFR